MRFLAQLRFLTKLSLTKTFRSSSSEEMELKYILSRPEYKTLLAETAGLAQVEEHLVNAYFDTPSLTLKANKFGLRIRLIDGKQAILCLKFPAKAPRGSPKGFKVRTEIEDFIPVHKALEVMFGKEKISQFNNAPMRKLREMVPADLVDYLEPLGQLETVRKKIEWINGHVLELDESLLFGKRFYELEVETNDPHGCDKAISKWFKRLGIGYSPGKKSKQARFFSACKRKALIG